MRRHLHIMTASAVAATLLGGFGTLGLGVTDSSAATAAPNCPTVSATIVKAALGGSPVAPPTQTANSNSFDGYKASVVSCTYSSNISISYSSPATLKDYNLALATLKHATVVSVVSGIGNDAFSGTGTNTIGSYNATTKKTTTVTVKTNNLWVLVTGKTFFEISASKVTLAQEEKLAKKMVPLV